MDKSKFAGLLAEELTQRGLTAENVADQLGVDSSTLTRWRKPRERQKPRQSDLQNLCRLFSLDTARCQAFHGCFYPEAKCKNQHAPNPIPKGAPPPRSPTGTEPDIPVSPGSPQRAWPAKWLAPLQRGWRAIPLWISLLVILAIGLVIVGLLSIRPAPPERLVFDFEQGDCQRWGKQPLNQPPQPCQSVAPSQERAYSGSYALRFDAAPYSVDRSPDAGISLDACGKSVTAHVYLPDGAPSIPVAIYVQDALWEWHESQHLDLYAARWNKLSFDMHGENWPTPCRTLGLHFTPREYAGSVFIDHVTIEQ